MSTRYPEGRLHGKKVLVVENDPDTLDMIVLVLKRDSAEVITAINGLDGFQQAQQHPDIIITDLEMPVMSGWAMVSALKKDTATKEIQVIALTGYNMTLDDRNRAVLAGFHFYMVKPIREETFVRELIHVLATKY